MHRTPSDATGRRRRVREPSLGSRVSGGDFERRRGDTDQWGDSRWRLIQFNFMALARVCNKIDPPAASRSLIGNPLMTSRAASKFSRQLQA